MGNSAEIAFPMAMKILYIFIDIVEELATVEKHSL